MSPLLEVLDLSVRYGETIALSGVNLTVGAGEVVGLLGPSGSGKTTFALAALGALPDNALVLGSVRFHGRAMAPVFQEPSGALHPMMRAGRQVEEVARARKRGDARAAMKEAGLGDPHLYDSYPHQLSGGQRQRVLIAQAIVGDPDLLIADEPTASLDAITESEVLEIFRRLKQRGTALIFITHYPRVLRRLADRVVTMERGSLC